jgi:secreted PhoX family phosphatase
MKPTKPVKELLDKEMSRKDFLKVAGMGALSVFGGARVVSYMLSNTKPAPQQDTVAKQTGQATHGFGSRKFGA